MAMLQLVRALTGVNGNTGKKKYIQKFFKGNYRSKATIWKSVLKSGCSHILQKVLKDSTKLFELCFQTFILSKFGNLRPVNLVNMNSSKIIFHRCFQAFTKFLLSGVFLNGCFWWADSKLLGRATFNLSNYIHATFISEVLGKIQNFRLI